MANGLGQRLSGVFGVQVALDLLGLVGADDALADRFQIGAQAGMAGVFALQDGEFRAVEAGQTRVDAVLGGLGGLSGLGALQRQHTAGFQAVADGAGDHAVALAARIDDAGLLEHRQQVGGGGQRLLGRRDIAFPQRGRLKVGAAADTLGGDARHRQDGALGRLHNGLVGILHALVEGGDKVGRGGLGLAAHGALEAAEKERQDDAAVAAGAAQQRRGGSRGDLLNGAVVRHGRKIVHGVADGHRHIGAGVAVRHGEYV